jgi:uncharacterized protein YjeT (DUF2065 family)
MQHLAPSRPAADDGVLRAGLLAVAAVQLAIGLWQALAPGAFYDALADFGPRNDHDLRDVATFYLASGVVLAVAAARPSWRAPALALVGLQFALHAANHLLDAGDADPSWVGVFDLVSLAAGAVLIWLLFRAADRDDVRAGRR